MIRHLRIDNRLIHGQVANTWIHSGDYDQVVACNDLAAADKLQSQLLLMAVRGVEAKVLSMEKDGKDITNNVYLTDTDIIYLKKLLEAGHEVSCQMLPNTSRISMKEAAAKW